MSHVSFPALGIEFTINRVAFSIGGFDVYWYGILLALSLALGLSLVMSKSKELGLDQDQILDVTLVSAVCAILNGRIFYILFDPDFTVSSIKEFFNLRGGGIAFYGVLLGGLAAAFVVCKIEKIRFRCLLDGVSLAMLFGQGLGRWGNFMNQETVGTNTDLPWGMYSDTIAKYIERNAEHLYEAHGIVLTDGPVHPCFLYESIWCFIGLFVMLHVLKKKRFDGEMFLKYLIWNGIGRGVIENFRTDALFLGNIRMSQFVCVSLAVIGAVILFITNRKIKAHNDPEYLKPYAQTEQFEADMAALKEKREAKKNKKNKNDISSESEAPVSEISTEEMESKEPSDSNVPEGESPEEPEETTKPENPEFPDAVDENSSEK